MLKVKEIISTGKLPMLMQYVHSFLLKTEFHINFNFGAIYDHLILIVLVIFVLIKEQKVNPMTRIFKYSHELGC